MVVTLSDVGFDATAIAETKFCVASDNDSKKGDVTMRKLLLLAGVATVTFGLGAAPAMAEDGWDADDLFSYCVSQGLTYDGPTQVQCAENRVEDPHYSWSNDHNKQIIKQDQDAFFWYEPYGTQQLQIGLNKVEEGDDNTQVIKQYQDLENNYYYGYNNLDQLQVGVNTVEDGDGNTQVIKQSQSLQIGGNPCGTCAQ